MELIGQLHVLEPLSSVGCTWKLFGIYMYQCLQFPGIELWFPDRPVRRLITTDLHSCGHWLRTESSWQLSPLVRSSQFRKQITILHRFCAYRSTLPDDRFQATKKRISREGQVRSDRNAWKQINPTATRIGEVAKQATKWAEQLGCQRF
jgi:hypothetical protein